MRRVSAWAAPTLSLLSQAGADRQSGTRIRRRGPRRRLPRDVRFHPDGPARTGGDPRPARGGPAALRLRGRDAAPAPALRRRPPRAARDLPHALPRRPLPRTPGNAEDVLVARTGAPAHDLRAARAARARRNAEARVRAPDV